MNFRFFSADDSPAALGFHAAHGGKSLGHTPAKAVAMRHLIKTVWRGDGSKLDRLKKDIVTRGHGRVPLGIEQRPPTLKDSRRFIREQRLRAIDQLGK